MAAALNEAKRLHPQGRYTLATQVATRLWPTPSASEGRQGWQDRKRGKKGTQESLTTKAIQAEGGRDAITGSLNPDWVEVLMGFPAGFTRLDPPPSTTAGRTDSPESLPESPTE